MSALTTTLEDYLGLRRSLGYKLERPGELLASFVAYLDAHGATRITIEVALAWATRSADASDRWRATQLGVVRCFARYAQAVDPAHEVPPVWLLPSGRHRPAPHLYSPDEIAALMAAAGQLRSPLRAATIETVIGLLAVSGIRVGEALRLDSGDIDVEHGVLAVRDSKAGKSRTVPLQPSTINALESYSARRDELCRPPSSDAMFVSTAGTRLRSGNLRAGFAEVLSRAGLPPRTARQGPRLADLRHTFAVRTLTRWHRDGLDVEALLPLLSTYMGHVSPASTYWYLSACPELLGAAAQRRQAATGGRR
ncbi:MAG: tyrosine-type recombinase/integrase [Solirubrobacteraceae bacterium]